MNTQEIGALVLSESFVMADAIAQVTPEAIGVAIRSYEAAQRPMASTEPAFANPRQRSERVTEISRALQTIGAKVSPTMNAEQATMWRDALLVSLSGWPANAVRDAATRATREPFKFLSDVDGRLHELAAEASERGKGALLRLKRMRAEIERSLNPPQPQIEHEPMVWTDEAIAACNANFAKLGIETRYRLAADGECEAYRANEKEGVATNEKEDM